MLEERVKKFLSKIDRSGGIDNCWPWTGHVGTDGYGQFRTQMEARVHRVMFRLATREEPGEALMHECDNRICCNPLHLRPGTLAENTRQAWDRGLMPSGERHYRARLSDQQVEDIRSRYSAGGVTQRVLADEYGVSEKHLQGLITHRCRPRRAV